MHCINLKKCFGHKHPVIYEESYRAQYGKRGRTVDPWLMILLCRFGHVYPHGGTTLAAYVDGHPKIARQLRGLDCCRVHQDGDDGELTVVFDVADFPKVAKIIRPRRRRRISQAERDRLRGMGFQKGRQRHYHVQYTGQERNRRPQPDSKAVGRQLPLFDR